jgi:hypothetical protein
MPCRQVILTETEWQHVYELVQDDITSWRASLRITPNSEFAPVIIQLNEGIVKKFDEAPDL